VRQPGTGLVKPHLPAAPAAPAAPPVDAEDYGRAGLEPDLLGTGIVSGPGNQGTANTALLSGHAGTGADFLSVPRQLKGGGWGSKPQ
jgi:hypothetical protein